MKVFLEKAIFVNRVPFENLSLDFGENEISVLSSVNGRGKTTILSHIVDAFYEMAKPHYRQSFVDKPDQFYRVSSPIHTLTSGKPSIVYLRFRTPEGKIDYVDIRENCTQDQYDAAISIEDKIPFERFSALLIENNVVKIFSADFDKKKAEIAFSNNILTFFPSYRFEVPGYLNNPYKVTLDFKKESGFVGYLSNPIEIISGLPQLANWIMDVVLDMQYPTSNSHLLKSNLDSIISEALVSKKYGNLRFGVGPRGYGLTRIQIIQRNETNDGSTIYPTIFNLSSGESSMLCLFGEILRQADTKNNVAGIDGISGIVLVDEVDKHLHIKLQKEVLPRLFNLFPNVQFIVSSHSPFLSMGLAEKASERSKIIDLDNFGISKDPTTNELYNEVYNMMVGENERFKEMYESINQQIEGTDKLQIVTEGKNNDHIKKAIEIWDATLLEKVHIINGAESKTGDQQLKNAFDVMSKGNFVGKFLFVWDCDSANIVNAIIETDRFKKFCFANNEENTKIKKGIENLYPTNYFTDDLYDTKMSEIEYGGSDTKVLFNKNRFLEKVKNETATEIFEKYRSLLEEIKEILLLEEVPSSTDNA